MKNENIGLVIATELWNAETFLLDYSLSDHKFKKCNYLEFNYTLIPPLKSRHFIITTHFVRQKKFVDSLCRIVPATSHRDIEIDFWTLKEAMEDR